MLNRLSLLLLVFVIAVPVAAESETNRKQPAQTWLDRHGIKKEWRQTKEATAYRGSGLAYKEKRGERMAPKLIIDTVSFFDGVAVFVLNTTPSRSRVRISPRSEDDIHILSVFDSTVINRTLDTIRVYSGSAANETRSEIQLMVQ